MLLLDDEPAIAPAPAGAVVCLWRSRWATEAAAGPDAGTSGPAEEPAAPEEDVVDAEFSEVDEENKG